jgi:SAM-dependent methyltransferase
LLARHLPPPHLFRYRRCVPDSDGPDQKVALSHLPAEQKAERAGSFGAVASLYERYRPGPPPAAVDWIIPTRVGRAIDLGAGTGALTRLLVDRADDVVAVEPDDRMRAVLADEVPGITVVQGRGESMPLPDDYADAVVASSSWHWVDPVPALHEVGRVLRPGGILGALWAGPDMEGDFIVQARALLAGQSGGGSPVSAGATDDDPDGAPFARLIMGDADRPTPTLEIPPGVPFDQPEQKVFTWDMALTADDLIGLLGTFSWIITMSEETRSSVLAEARRLLRELLGVEGEVTVDVAYRCEAWRSRRHS